MLAHGFLSGGSVCRAGRAAHPVAVLIQNNRKGCPERGIPFPVFGASRATAALRKNACRAQRTEGAAPAAAAETERRRGAGRGAAEETAEHGFLRAESGAGGLPVPHEFYRICENRHFRRGRTHRLRRRGAGRGVECRLRRGVQAAAWSADCGRECRPRQGRGYGGSAGVSPGGVPPGAGRKAPLPESSAAWRACRRREKRRKIGAGADAGRMGAPARDAPGCR